MLVSIIGNRLGDINHYIQYEYREILTMVSGFLSD